MRKRRTPLDIVIHVGPRYTGSGGIRAQLVGGRDELAASGTFVPPLPIAPRPWNNLAWQVADDHRFDPDLSNWRSLIQQAAASGAQRMIVSSDELAPALRRPGAARRLHQLTGRARGRVQVVATLRDQASLLNTAYATRAAQLGTITTFERFVRAPVPRKDFSFGGMLTPLLEVSDDVLFVTYDDLMVRDGLSALLAAVGGDVDGLELPPFVPAPEPDVLTVQAGLFAARLLSAHKRTAGDVERRRVAALCERLRREHPAPSPAFWGWTDGLLVRHQRQFASDADGFAERTGVAPPRAPQRHPQRPSATDLDPAAFADLLDGVHALATTQDRAPRRRPRQREATSGSQHGGQPTPAPTDRPRPRSAAAGTPPRRSLAVRVVRRVDRFNLRRHLRPLLQRVRHRSAARRAP